MKKIFLPVLVFCSFQLNAQIDPKTSSNGANIVPEKNLVRVGGTVNINLYDQYGTLQSGPFIGSGARQQIGSRYWVINGVRDGDDKVGYVSPPSNSSTSIGIYTAPKIMPLQNPVVIQFYFEYYSEAAGKEIWGVVSCKIEVFDAYKVTVVHKFTTDHDAFFGDGELSDSANCIVYVYPGRVIIESINNFQPQIIKEGGYMGVVLPGANKKYIPKQRININGAEGPVHLTKEVSNLKFTGDYPPEVDFDLAQKKDLVVCQMHAEVMGKSGPPKTLKIDKPWPVNINFIANGQHQKINVVIGSVVVSQTNNTYTLLVNRVQ